MIDGIRRRDFTIFALATAAGLLIETLTARSGQATGMRRHMPPGLRLRHRQAETHRGPCALDRFGAAPCRETESTPLA